MRVLVTGANGFVGRAVFDRFCTDSDIEVVGAVRSNSSSGIDAMPMFEVGDVGADTDWSSALLGVDVVVHLAARAHVLAETHPDPLSEFRRVNVEGALVLLRQAIASKVRRFVFISSIGVNGNVTEREPFSERSPATPHAAYAVSKHEAEQALQSLAQSNGIELVIIRPPLVYAAHAPGNFARLLKLVDLGLPLPFGSVQNLRSMVALGNLVDFIGCCVRHPAAAGQTFLISDGDDVSLPQMLQLLGQGMHKRCVLIPFPPALMRLAAGMLGKSNLYNQLCGSLQVDSAKSRALLGWTPPQSGHTALVETGAAFKA